MSKRLPCEPHNSSGAGERYNAPLRKMYQKLKFEHPTMNNELGFSIATYGLKNTANPEGLIPSLLVLGTIPKIPLGNLKHLCRNQKERFEAMELARKAMEKMVVEQRLKIASKSRTKEIEIFDICLGFSVLVYREKKKTVGATVSSCFV